jgi:Na+/proline symporter
MGEPLNVAGELGRLFGGSWGLGMALHFLIGVFVLPGIFIWLFYFRLPGAPWVKGIEYGVIIWLVAEIVVVPLSGGGFFHSGSGGASAVLVSFIGNVIYGYLLGAVTGRSEPELETHSTLGDLDQAARKTH